MKYYPYIYIMIQEEKDKLLTKEEKQRLVNISKKIIICSILDITSLVLLFSTIYMCLFNSDETFTSLMLFLSAGVTKIISEIVFPPKKDQEFIHKLYDKIKKLDPDSFN